MGGGLLPKRHQEKHSGKNFLGIRNDAGGQIRDPEEAGSRPLANRSLFHNTRKMVVSLASEKILSHVSKSK